MADPENNKFKGAKNDSTAELLASLAGHQLTTLLLEVFSRKLSQIDLGDIKLQHRKDRVVQPSDIDQRQFNLLDKILYDCLPGGYEAIELSPVNSFGLNSRIASTSQKNVLTTIRGQEVVGDASTSLALEAARRRSLNRDSEVNLCTSHRSLRLQRYEDPKYSPHFRVFSLISADKDRGHEIFEVSKITEHLMTYIQFLSISLVGLGYEFKDFEITISDIKIAEQIMQHHQVQKQDLGRLVRSHKGRLFGTEEWLRPDNDPPLPSDDLMVNYGLSSTIEQLTKIGRRVSTNLKTDFPGIKFVYELDRISGIGHYCGTCFRLCINGPKGKLYIADGGMTDWSAKLNSNFKERTIVSGIGTELLYRVFLKLSNPLST